MVADAGERRVWQFYIQVLSRMLKILHCSYVRTQHDFLTKEFKVKSVKEPFNLWLKPAVGQVMVLR